MLVNPMDMGNFGTIIRSMLAFDFKNLITVSPCVDIFDPKVIRASQGAIFGVDVQMYESAEYYFLEHKNSAYLFATSTEKSFENAQLNEPYTLVFGNESQGLSADLLEKGIGLSIKQSTEVDSLNLATSVAIVLHKLFSEKV